MFKIKNIVITTISILLMSKNIAFGYSLRNHKNRSQEKLSITELLESEKHYTYNERKNIDIGNRLGYILDLKASGEFTLDGLHYRKIETNGEFFDKNSNKPLAKNSLKVLFSYNNQKAYIQNHNLIERYEKGLVKKMNILGRTHVLTSDSQCIVSSTWGIFDQDKALQPTWAHYDNFHIDLLCCKDGNFNYNIKSMNKINDDMVLKESMVYNNYYENVAYNIDRRETVIDKYYIYNKPEDSDDVFNYVTREIKLSYIGPEGDKLANVVLGANFRYNKERKEATCLSTYDNGVDNTNKKKSNKLNNKGNINLFMRKGNEIKNKAGAYGTINIKYEQPIIDKVFDDIVTIKCDHYGNITSSVVKAE